HRFGIYGPQDYNAWLAKISCERLSRGVDGDAYKSATFLQRNLTGGIVALHAGYKPGKQTPQ
ncbi:hypothetical protein FVP45_11590, partial [Mycobacterium tuberculosis]|nr:hypothetical protein [Mycobacterium tuberculosis]